MKSVNVKFTLFDDASVAEKLTIMSKWDAVCDDARNEELDDLNEQFEELLQVGKTYRLILEEVI